MHYLIDGYNLLFRMVSHSENLQNRRQAIIEDLNQKISLLDLNVSIVFDAAFQMGDATRSHYDHLEILFTAHGESADDYILEQIKNSLHPEEKTVVTSDKKLAWFLRNLSAKTENVEDFLLWLNRAYRNKLQQQKKQKKQEVALPSPSPSRQTLSPQPSSPERLFVPQKDAPVAACADYYLQVFEKEFEEILKKEKIRKEAISSHLEKKSKPRKPKKRPDPFETPQTAEEKAASDMERWLKIFEQRL